MPYRGVAIFVRSLEIVVWVTHTHEDFLNEHKNGIILKLQTNKNPFSNKMTVRDSKVPSLRWRAEHAIFQPLGISKGKDSTECTECLHLYWNEEVRTCTRDLSSRQR